MGPLAATAVGEEGEGEDGDEAFACMEGFAEVFAPAGERREECGWRGLVWLWKTREEREEGCGWGGGGG